MSTINQIQVDVKLNQAESEMVAKLPESLRATVTESILNAKRESMQTVLANRTIFSVSINDIGNIAVRGLGNSRPMGFRPDSLETLLSHVPELTKAVADARSYIAANPAKVEAATKLRDQKKAELKKGAKLSLVATK